VVEAMAQTAKDPLVLARALSSLAGRLEPHEAAAHTAKAARTLVEAMTKANTPMTLSSLARALSSLPGRVEPHEAATAARVLIDAMTKTAPTQQLVDLPYLAPALSSLAGLLEQHEAAALTPQLVKVMAKATDPQALSHVAQALSSLATRLEPHEAADQAVLVARALGEEALPATRLSGLATLLQASRPLPSRLTTQELVDLLKMPTCVGRARDVVLKMLGQRYHRTFADQWAFVDYAEKHLPDIDLKSPPQRPQL
jgi:hypothetical protein